MKKIILVFTLMLLSNVTIAQNITMAKAFYKKAQKEYENQKYYQALELIDKAKEKLNGETNLELVYLEGMSRYQYDKNVDMAKSLLNRFIEEADQDDSRVDEIAQLLVEIETSYDFYENGFRKKLEYIGVNENKYVHHYDKDGVQIKMVCYSSAKDYKLSFIHYGKSLKEVVRREYYDENEKIESVDYYENNTRRLKIWGNGEHIHLYDEKGKFIQRYGLKEFNLVDGIFYSFKSFESWENYIAYFLTSKYDSSANILDIHNNLSIELIDKHKNIISGIVKKLKVDNNKYDKEHYIYNFDIDGVPTSKEFYKRGKLKKSYTFNKYDNSWSEI